MTPSLSCEKAAELLSHSLDERLGILDQLLLKYHLSICDDCRNVDAQMKQLSGLMHSPDAMGAAEMPELNANITTRN